MKKYFCILLCLIILFAFAACANKNLDFNISISELKESIHFDFQSENSNITVFADTKEKSDKILSCILNESSEFTKNTFPNAKFTVVSIDLITDDQ